MSSVLFSAEELNSSPDLFLGAKQQVVLIYEDFITRKECFRMSASYLQPPPGHACSPCSVVLMKDYSLMFSIKNRVSLEKGERREGEEKKVNNRVTKKETKTDKITQSAGGLTC